jgi:hypothetical protein
MMMPNTERFTIIAVRCNAWIGVLVSFGHAVVTTAREAELQSTRHRARDAAMLPGLSPLPCVEPVLLVPCFRRGYYTVVSFKFANKIKFREVSEDQ